MDARTETGPAFDIEERSGDLILHAKGAWVLALLSGVDRELRALADGRTRGRRFVLDLGAVTRLDTAGAYVLHRTAKAFRDHGLTTETRQLTDTQQTLFDEIERNDQPCEREPPTIDPLVEMLARIGDSIAGAFAQARSVMNLWGVVMSAIGRAIRQPSRLRTTSLVHHMEQAGLDAVPIVSLLTFLVGAVVGFLGAKILRQFGAEVLTVELIAYSILRELGVLLTAIIVAGRSGSAFTAQIGSMKVNEEIDAMKTIGLDPTEVLVLPRVLAFVLMVPLLTFVADIMGLVGGIIVSSLLLDISPTMFLVRMSEWVTVNNFWAGIIKAPFFAFVSALIGCHEGLAVEGSAESVGSRTTSSVVQSIFMVIVIDALFAMFYLEVDF